MSKSRLFSGFVIVALIAVAVLLVHGGIVTSEVTASQNAVLDQQDRHPGFVNQNASDSLKVAASAEQAHVEFRRGEWNAGSTSTAAAVAEQAATIRGRAGGCTRWHHRAAALANSRPIRPQPIRPKRTSFTIPPSAGLLLTLHNALD